MLDGGIWLGGAPSEVKQSDGVCAVEWSVMARVLWIRGI